LALWLLLEFIEKEENRVAQIKYLFGGRMGIKSIHNGDQLFDTPFTLFPCIHELVG
jgi:hypothetical protein